MKLMAITVPRAELVDALALCGSVAYRRGIIPVLSNIKIDAPEGSEHVRITATDIDLTLDTHVSARIKNPGGTTIEHRALYGALRSLDADEASIEVEPNKSVTVICGTARFTLPATGPEDFPTPPQVEPLASVTFRSADLLPILHATAYATANDEREALACVLLRVEKKRVDVAASDGNRLALHAIAMHCESARDAFIPRRAIAVIEKLTGDELTLAMDDSNVRVTAENATLIARMPSGYYPDYRSAIKASLDNRLLADRGRLLSMVRRASSFANEKTRGLMFNIESGRVTVRSRHVERGAIEDYVPADYAGEAARVLLNGNYVADALSAISTDQVAVLFSGSDVQVQFLPEPPMETGEALHVVMPMRID